MPKTLSVMPKILPAMLLAWAVLAAALPSRSSAADRRPNVVFILTDNHGAWTLGCYGNPDIRSPNLDRLAAEGVLFTRALSCNPVCSPTRATYLTGLLPSQHGVHSFLGGEKPDAQMGPDAYCTIREFANLPQILHHAGYICGLSGKWHLGDSLRPQLGFSSWITMPRGHTTEFYDADVIEHGQVRQEPTYLTDLWTAHGQRFIEENRDRPFFLYLAYNGPYALGRLLLNPARNRHAEYYQDQPLLSFPRDAMHPWQFHNKQFLNNPVSIRRVAAEVSGVDDGVGQILQTLQRLGLDDNTIVVFAGDQGWMGGQNGLWGMGDHTRPVGAHELMMHVPLIVRFPGRAIAGQRRDEIVSNYDFFPTMLSLLQLSDRRPTSPPLPGRDLTPLLTGQSPAWDNTVYYEMEGCRAVRTTDWKYVARHPSGPYELYDMVHDPRERFNLYGQPDQTGRQAALAAQLDAFFAQHASPEYDVWRGGRSKAGRLVRTDP